MQITTVLTNAAPRIVNKRDGSGSFTLYELFDHEGTAWVVKADVYNNVLHLIGQTVNMVVRVEQNGQWTNRFADIVIPAQAGAQVPASNAAEMAMAAAQAAQRVQPTMPQMPNTAQIQDVSVFPTRKDASINRQTAAKVAAQISGDNPSAFWANCVDLARYFDTGQVPGNPTQEYAQASGGYQDEGIPFGKAIYNTDM